MVEAPDPLDSDEPAPSSLVVVLDGPLGRDGERRRRVPREHNDPHARHERAQRLVKHGLVVRRRDLRRAEDHERHVRAERARLVHGPRELRVGHAVDRGGARGRRDDVRDRLWVARGEVAVREVGRDPVREEGRARFGGHALVHERRPRVRGDRLAERDGGRLCAGEGWR